MPSQLDLDQGGTVRQTQLVNLGPSVGWVLAPYAWYWAITTAGTTNILRGTSVVTINVNGNVNVQLPSAKQNPAGPQAVPGSFIGAPVTILDLGGFAPGAVYTILPFGAELIDGLASIVISSQYGLYQLQPNLISGGWNLRQ
jgi:hypothetical protein